jgi:hypothetical protein
MGRSAIGKGGFVSSYEDFTHTPLFLFYINYFQSDIIHYPPTCKEQTTNIVVPWRLQHKLYYFLNAYLFKKNSKRNFFLGRKVKNLLKNLFFIITPS